MITQNTGAPALRTSFVDGYAISLSGLCMIHCLAPILIPMAIPFSAELVEAEGVHRLLVLMALPAGVWVVSKSWSGIHARVLTALIGGGLLLLFAGAFAAALENHERALTVCGALALAAGHGMHLRDRLHNARVIEQ